VRFHDNAQLSLDHFDGNYLEHKKMKGFANIYLTRFSDSQGRIDPRYAVLFLLHVEKLALRK
jgi:hypothetical protein